MTSSIHLHFDKVYVLSLPSEVQRRARMERMMGKYGIDFEFFDAIDGNEVKFDKEWNYYSLRPIATAEELLTGKKLISSRGAWGCLKSYISLIRRIMDLGYERVLIFEDDAILSNDFEMNVAHFFSLISTDWKLVMLGAIQSNWDSQKFENGYYHPTPLLTKGAWAIGYHRSILPTILYESLRMEFPYDKEPIAKVMRDYSYDCYVAYPNIVIGDVRESSIRKSRSLEDVSVKMKWQLNNFTIE